MAQTQLFVRYIGLLLLRGKQLCFLFFLSLAEMHEWQISGAATTAEFDDFLATSSPTLSTFSSVTTQDIISSTATSANATITSNGSGMDNMHASNHPTGAIIGGGLSLSSSRAEYFY